VSIISPIAQPTAPMMIALAATLRILPLSEERLGPGEIMDARMYPGMLKMAAIVCNGSGNENVAGTGPMRRIVKMAEAPMKAPKTVPTLLGPMAGGSFEAIAQMGTASASRKTDVAMIPSPSYIEVPCTPDTFPRHPPSGHIGNRVKEHCAAAANAAMCQV